MKAVAKVSLILEFQNWKLKISAMSLVLVKAYVHLAFTFDKAIL